MNISKPVSKQISKVSFGLYTPDEIRKVSVKQITCPRIFDLHGQPTPGGLYDAALGPYSNTSFCTTCSQNYFECPGHFGHIELPLPVYNPTMFPTLFNLIRGMCFDCYRLRLNGLTSLVFFAKLMLLNHGHPEHCLSLDTFLTEKKDDEDEEEETQNSSSLFSFVQKCLTEKRKQKTSLDEKCRNMVMQDFMRRIKAASKCFHCGSKPVSLRQDSKSKIFVIMQQDRPVCDADILSAHAAMFPKGQHPNWESNLEEPVLARLQEKQTSNSNQYLNQHVIKCLLEMLWSKESKVLDLLFDSSLLLNFNEEGSLKNQVEKFFFTCLPVPPIKFRPASQHKDTTFDHPQNIMLKVVLEECEKIQQKCTLLRSGNNFQEELSAMSYAWIALQQQVNLFIDNQTKSSTTESPAGIRQLLEKKEGLFRKHMMGKRVNYAARSVISPDPWIEPGEIGIPMVFAKKLTYPEPVTGFNLNYLMQCVINGPTKWPGATHIQMENGILQSLDIFDQEQRENIAHQLLALENDDVNKKVYRHLKNGDIVLVNRQPTLHKPSIMAHRVKVLCGEKTIRMHYANCNTYNADFDGDEMNIHFPQNELARAEAYFVANTENQYLSPTDGSPLRGLIQDHVVIGVSLTQKDCFLTKAEYHDLLMGSLPESVMFQGPIQLMKPTILKPRTMYTGKQVISTLLMNILLNQPKLNLKSKTKVQKSYWGPGGEEEAEVLIIDNDLIHGVLDKSQFGASSFGLVHSVYELYGAKTAGDFLGSLGRLFSKYVQQIGFTCRMDDLLLSPQGDRDRLQLLHENKDLGPKVCLEYTKSTKKNLTKQLEEISRESSKLAGLDSSMKSATNKLTSQIISKCIPRGLMRQFPHNGMQLMTVSGAKGSNVNVSQISCCLGQQELEGRRVPLMVSGKTLPSFEPWDQSARAGGFIQNRFLTGIKPQEYFFHCMAGREGLIDTAVKTSRSGYLQRCLVKHLETLKVHYDGSVRNAEGSIFQFLYGDDCLDVTKQKHLTDFEFCSKNYEALTNKHKITELRTKVDEKTASKLKKQDPKIIVQSVLSPYQYLGSVSEKFFLELKEFKNTKLKRKAFEAIMNVKYLKSLVEPGECVGVLAAQSIGEPSTQMTLNTFHFAGFGAKNVTLGIPRLREIIMVASKNIKTPTMTLYFNCSQKQKAQFCQSLTKLTLSAIVKRVVISEKTERFKRKVLFKLEFYRESEYNQVHDLNFSEVLMVVQQRFSKTLELLILKEYKKVKRAEVLAMEDLICSTITKMNDATEDRYEDREKEKGIYQDDEDLIEEVLEEKEELVLDIKTKHVTDFLYDQKKQTCCLELSFPQDWHRIMMTRVAEQAVKSTVIREIKGIQKCFLQENVAVTEGVNLQDMFKFDFLNLNKIRTNDVFQVLECYGIEAARATIISEIAGVFDVYGISVDVRHLTLVADYMTFEGTYRPFNRQGISSNTSPFLKMSFESTCQFLTSCVLHSDYDLIQSPSACLVVGNPCRCGTNALSIVQKL